jgi:hypothetical protein
MATRWTWLAAAGLPLFLIGGLPAFGVAAGTEPAAQPPAKTANAEKSGKTEETATKAPEAAANPAATAKAPEAERTAGLVGKVIAVTPASDTIVVDVPLGKETLRIGAMTTDRTRILVDGKKAALDILKPGERVRIAYYRTDSGDVATLLQVLQPSMG